MTVREVGVAEAVALVGVGYRVIDVRQPAEWASGHIAGAVLLPLGDLADRIGAVVPDPSTPLIVHCAVGERSARAAAWLHDHGYSGVVNMRGDLSGWAEAGGAWKDPGALTPLRTRRYARQMRLPEIGVGGQLRLLDSRILLVGAGGLGSPAALYLAAAGVGTIGVVDDDVVDESNLGRQILHATDRVGMAKVDSAERTLRALNADATVVKHAERLTVQNVDSIIGRYEVIVDGTDSLETRYVINDAAVRLRRPVVHGSVYRWVGQVTTLVPFEGPCYRCMHPVRPPDVLVLDCDVAGVVGVLPGIIGTLQAAEVIKLILGAGEPLVGRLLIVDALGAAVDEMRIARDANCSACGGVAGRTAAAAITPA